MLAGPFLQSFISSYEFSAYFPAYVLFQLQIHSSCKFIQLCPVETCVHKIQTQWDTKIEYIKKIFNSQLIFRKLTLIECQASIGYSNNWSKTCIMQRFIIKNANRQVKSLNNKCFIQAYIVVIWLNYCHSMYFLTPTWKQTIPMQWKTNLFCSLIGQTSIYLHGSVLNSK